MTIQKVAQNIAFHLKSKLQNVEHKIFVDLNIFVVPIVVTDTHLAPLAKKIFAQLPLPIRNLVLATGEMENEKVNSQIRVLEEDTRSLIHLLEDMVHCSSSARDSLKESNNRLQNSAITIWKQDIEVFRQEVEDIVQALKNEYNLEFEVHQDLYESCKLLETKILNLKCKGTFELQPTTFEMNTSIVESRIETSQQYREHAKRLHSDTFKVEDISEHKEIERKDPNEEPVQTTMNVKSTIILDDLEEKVRKIRNKIAQKWLPHRKAIQNSMNSYSFENTLLDCIAKLEHFESSKISNENSFQKTQQRLQKEFEYAIPTFPCDKSALKTCLLVMSEGPKISMCRKLKETKQELTRTVSMYMSQLNSIFVEYHELLHPDSKL